MAAYRAEDYCMFCENRTKTKYRCITCDTPACNLCTSFESNEDVVGWCVGKCVGYCRDCLNFPRKAKKMQLEESEPNVGEERPATPASSTTSERSSREARSSGSLSDDDAEEISPPTGKGKGKQKRSGRRSQWPDEALDDFVDIIVANEYYQRKLIFTNTKNQQNGFIYAKILEELKKRCIERGEVLDLTVVQLRNKFKKCVSECKNVALTIKTATGVQRFQEEKGYSTWFNNLYPLVKTRDSCQPEMAEEPSSKNNDQELDALDCSGIEESGEKEKDDLSNEKQFIPLKKRKTTHKDHLSEAVTLLKQVIEQDPGKDLMAFMQQEAEKARQHELEVLKLLLNSRNDPFPSTSQPQEAPNQLPFTNHAQHWQQGYIPTYHNFQQHTTPQHAPQETIPQHQQTSQLTSQVPHQTFFQQQHMSQLPQQPIQHIPNQFQYHVLSPIQGIPTCPPDKPILNPAAEWQDNGEKNLTSL